MSYKFLPEPCYQVCGGGRWGWVQWPAKRPFKPKVKGQSVPLPVVKTDTETATILTEVADHLKKPRLITSGGQRTGSVSDLVPDVLKPTEGVRVEIEGVYQAYCRLCDARDLRPVRADQFITAMQAFCQACDIASTVEGTSVYLEGVRLTKAA